MKAATRDRATARLIRKGRRKERRERTDGGEETPRTPQSVAVPFRPMASLLSSSATLHHNSLSLTSPSAAVARAGPHRLPRIRAVSSAEPQKETPAKSSTEATKTPVPTRSPTSLPKKPVYSSILLFRPLSRQADSWILR